MKKVSSKQRNQQKATADAIANITAHSKHYSLMPNAKHHSHSPNAK